MLSVGKGDPYSKIVNDFNIENPDTPIRLHDYNNLLRRFKETGMVLFINEVKDLVNKEKNHNQEDIDSVLYVTSQNPHTSVSRSSLITGISQKKTLNILKKCRYHPYKLNLMQELKPSDHFARLELCNFFRSKFTDDPIFLRRVLFSDEATFTTNGIFNRQNFRMWSNGNPNWYAGLKSQWHEKVNVWVGMLDTHLIGPFYFDGNINSESYINMLENDLMPKLQELGAPLYFQQDGAPAHYANATRDWLDGHFPNRWIGRGGPIQWPPRSPDLTPLDFSIWGILKNNVYKTTIESKDHLKERIAQEVNSITPIQLLNMLDNLKKRVHICIAQNGGHFENLLK